MNFINEYSLLFAVALPVVTIAGMQAFLFISGERGTGLFPAVGGYPSIEFGRVVEVAPRQSVVPAATAATAAEPSNDEAERIAA
jgi:hypothetical protein